MHKILLYIISILPEKKKLNLSHIEFVIVIFLLNMDEFGAKVEGMEPVIVA